MSYAKMLGGAALSVLLSQRGAAFDLASPSGRTTISVTETGDLTWSVKAGQRTVLAPSRLGLALVDGPVPRGTVELTRHQVRDVDEAWDWAYGGQSRIVNRYREATLQFRETRAGGRSFALTLRAYDDGAAFRYVLPHNFAGSQKLRVTGEKTQFVFERDYPAWIGDHRSNFSHQECDYTRGPLSRLKPESFGTAPIVVDLGDGLWVGLAEAALANWAGMYYCGGDDSSEGGAVTLVSKLSARPEGDVRPTVETPLPARSPWRVVMIGSRPGDLLQSNLLLNLNDPCRIGDLSWVKPGMSAWDHWWHGDQKMETAVIKQYVDLAAEMGWPYQLIDWHWYGDPEKPGADVFSIAPSIDLPEVRRYAAEKGVKLWIWLQWDDIEKPEVYRKIFSQLHDEGYVGVKIDYMQRDDQAMVEWYADVVKCAADFELMVDFHGAYKPTGECRTWPNLITREGVKGNEFNKWSHEVTPTHRATLPFTRNLLGPADFTPGGFNNRQPAQHQTSATNAEVQGTRANELALFVVYLSPFMCVCDHPDNLRGQAGADFLKLVPTVWDETRVLEDRIGELAVIARRSGQRWFVGAITNEQPREVELDLGFLPPGAWHAKIWADGANAAEDAADLATSEELLGEQRSLSLRLAPSGGAAILLEPEK